MAASRLEDMRQEIAADIEAAITAAENDPDPDPATLTRYVYGEDAE